MTGLWRTLTLAAVFYVMTAAGVAAQTVIVTKASPGASVEITFNGAVVGTGTVDDSGNATVDVKLAARGAKKETDVRVSVDLCETMFRVHLHEPGVQLSAAAGPCTRADVQGVYVMREASSFVVDVSQPAPAVWLRQGPAPKSWLFPQAEGEEHEWTPLPSGLVLAFGGDMAGFGNALTMACGDAPTCGNTGRRIGIDAKVTWWVNRMFGLEASYLQPAILTATGSGDRYHFTSELKTRVLTFGPRIGIPVGPARIYATGGAAYHWAWLNTTQTVDASSVTVGGVTTAIPGGTEAFGIKAPKWSWLAGGGVEIWVKRPVALYVEGGYAPVKGDDTRGGDGRLDDRIIYGVVGLQVHIGR